MTAAFFRHAIAQRSEHMRQLEDMALIEEGKSACPLKLMLPEQLWLATTPAHPSHCGCSMRKRMNTNRYRTSHAARLARFGVSQDLPVLDLKALEGTDVPVQRISLRQGSSGVSV